MLFCPHKPMDKPWALPSLVSSSAALNSLCCLCYLHGAKHSSELPMGQSFLMAGPMQPPPDDNFCTASMNKCLALICLLLHMREKGINELLERPAGSSRLAEKSKPTATNSRNGRAGQQLSNEGRSYDKDQRNAMCRENCGTTYTAELCSQ